MSTITILNNKKCQIVLEDEKLFKKLYRFLSFRVAGYQYSPAYQNGGWNGTTYLMSKGGKFDLGLLEKVKGFLSDNDAPFSIEDKRPPKIVNQELDISVALEKHNLIPREHQIRIRDLVDTYDRGIIRAATASGKSLCTALMIAKINKPTILYCIGLDLLDQFYKLFSQLFDEKIGYIGNGICDPARITVASIWTIGRALSLDKDIFADDEVDLSEKDVSETNRSKIIDLLKQTKVHILDECHVASCGTISAIYKNIDPEYIYGFSGTPFRDDNTNLISNSILGEQIINVSASELIEKKIIAQPIIKFITVPKMHLSGSQYLSVYKEYIVENNQRNNLIVESLKDLLKRGYTPLLLFKQIKHGNILLEKILDAGIKCEMLFGNDSLERRNEVKQMLINKEIDTVAASTIFDIGLNWSHLSGLILCGGGCSTVKSLQRVGRALRMTENKKYAAVVDFYDQAKYLKKHSQIRCDTYSSESGFKVIKSKEMK